jgi:hypothetical protein
MQIHQAYPSAPHSPSFGQAGAARRAAQVTAIAALAIAGLAGDSVNISQAIATPSLTQVCNSAVSSVDNTPETAFSFPVEFATQLLESADGMQEDPNWPGYPKHSINTWGVGFTNSGEFETDPSDKKGPKKNKALDFEEAILAATQLGWDMSLDAQTGNDDTINRNAITPDLANQARAFFAFIFWNAPETSPPGQVGKLRPGVDANEDGVFNAEDLFILAHGKKEITAGDLTRAGC